MGLYNKNNLISNEIYFLEKGIPNNPSSFKELINIFNKEHKLDIKIDLGNKIIKELGFNIFGTCSICGEIIIYNHTKLYFRSNNLNTAYKINIVAPSEYKREIYGTIYNLSCCEKCLLEHFKEYPPKTNTLMFSRGQRWSAFVYNVPDDISAKLRKETVAVTKESLIRKYGEKNGLERWEQYCKKQSYSNTFEYKHKKYGWTKEQFDKFNASRAVTLKNLQNKYGDELGKTKFTEYCERQRYTNSLEYMIETYGDELGKLKFDKFCEARANASPTNTYSNISQVLFDKIYNELNKANVDTSKIYYHNLNKELYFRDYKNNIGYKPDFIDLSKNLIIEFQGDYWHANPSIYKQNDKIKPEKVEAKVIWEQDKLKEEYFTEKLKNVIYLKIWESEFRNDPINTINKILSHYNIQYNENELYN